MTLAQWIPICPVLRTLSLSALKTNALFAPSAGADSEISIKPQPASDRSQRSLVGNTDTHMHTYNTGAVRRLDMSEIL